MKELQKKYRFLTVILLCCVIQMAGCAVYAQQIVPQKGKVSLSGSKWERSSSDSPKKGHAPLNREKAVENDSISPATDAIPEKQANDSIATLSADSIQQANEKNLEQLEPDKPIVLADSTGIVGLKPVKTRWIPNSTKATWLAVVFPGAGQIYNKKYWKLPIIYGGFAGCAYALTWNNNMYKDYSQAYMDITDSDPNTNSHLNLLPPNYRFNESQLKELIRKRKDTYRRYRDLSIFAVIGVYLISVIDAYVDAELSNFDITPDLSLRIEPTINTDNKIEGGKNVGVQCSLRF